MSDNRNMAGKLLGSAADTVMRSRPGVHGSAENSFEMIGELWTVYLRHTRRTRTSDAITPSDVAQMMSMLKKARAIYGDVNNDDNFVDDIGYTALAGMLQLPDAFATAEERVERELDKIDLLQTKHTGIDDRPVQQRIAEAKMGKGRLHVSNIKSLPSEELEENAE